VTLRCVTCVSPLSHACHMRVDGAVTYGLVVSTDGYICARSSSMLLVHLATTSLSRGRQYCSVIASSLPDGCSLSRGRSAASSRHRCGDCPPPMELVTEIGRHSGAGTVGPAPLRRFVEDAMYYPHVVTVTSGWRSLRGRPGNSDESSLNIARWVCPSANRRYK
jgi:hypothetical protein